MNDKKIAFIICSNNSLYYEECVWYINRLHLPKQYEKDIIRVTDAQNIFEAYNAAMKSSDAKYKVYLHHDVFIYNTSFIYNILDIFQNDKQIGMIGVVGGVNLPDDADIWNSWNVGSTYGCNIEDAFPIICYQDPQLKYIEVEAVDGMLMATQYDVEWREDIFNGWDFYDISESLEFAKKGYKVVIPYQELPWCMHDCGHSKLLYYDENRKIMLENYSERFKEKFVMKNNSEYIVQQEKLFIIIKKYIEEGKIYEIVNILEKIKCNNIVDNNLQYALNMMYIYVAESKINEQNVSFFENLGQWNSLKEKYDKIKFLLRRVENGDVTATDKIIEMLKKKKISKEALEVIAAHSIIYKQKVIEMLLYNRIDDGICMYNTKTGHLEEEISQVRMVVEQIDKILYDICERKKLGLEQDEEIIKLVVDTMKEVDNIMGKTASNKRNEFYINIDNNRFSCDCYDEILRWRKDVIKWLDKN